MPKDQNGRLLAKLKLYRLVHFGMPGSYLTPFDAQEWLVSNFSLQYHPWITHYGHENEGNDHQP